LNGATPARGALLLVPNTLDFGGRGALPDLRDVLPDTVIARAAALGHWAVENAKTARAFLKRVDAVHRLTTALQSIDIVELPRPQKGTSTRVDATATYKQLLAPAIAGHDVGLLSEAGMPAVADPGAELVAAAHALGLQVVPLTGPSALLLALAASGLHGQSFAFVGYLPTDADARAARIRELEALSRRARQTQLLIETPYRNAAMHAALVAQLQPSTRLSVSCGLTMPGGATRTDRVGDWRARPQTLPADVPAVFAVLAD
jgi:16S rRNA (cytidine1402-2'-O)-methyltransferase